MGLRCGVWFPERLTVGEEAAIDGGSILGRLTVAVEEVGFRRSLRDLWRHFRLKLKTTPLFLDIQITAPSRATKRRHVIESKSLKLTTYYVYAKMANYMPYKFFEFVRDV